MYFVEFCRIISSLQEAYLVPTVLSDFADPRCPPRAVYNLIAALTADLRESYDWRAQQLNNLLWHAGKILDKESGFQESFLDGWEDCLTLRVAPEVTDLDDKDIPTLRLRA